MLVSMNALVLLRLIRVTKRLFGPDALKAWYSIPSPTLTHADRPGDGQQVIATSRMPRMV
jgi:hypothetical protein